MILLVLPHPRGQRVGDLTESSRHRSRQETRTGHFELNVFHYHGEGMHSSRLQQGEGG